MPRVQRAGRAARRVALGVALGRAVLGRAVLGGAVFAGAACAPSAPGAVGPAVRDAWARPAAAGADGALYFTVVNATRDTIALVGARSDVAATTSLHESMRMGAGAAAMVHMTPVARLAVPPADSVRFAPLGRHAMLERLRRPLAVGDSVPFALAVVRGAHTDTLRATAVVRAF